MTPRRLRRAAAIYTRLARAVKWVGAVRYRVSFLRRQVSPKKPKQSYRSRVRRHVLTEPATAILAEIAEELVRVALADHPDEKTVSLLAISLSHLEQHWKLQLELPLGLEDEKRRPGSRRGMARWTADRAIDLIRDRFGWDAVGYGSVMLGLSRSVPDEFRELAEKNL
jgi:DNA polymerase-4